MIPFTRIEVNPRILLGKPVIRGTRIPVALILNLLAKGYTVERILLAYSNLTRADVIAAIRYSGARMDRERIVAALEEMKANPFAGDMRPIQGEINLYRRQVGSYRVYFRPIPATRLLDIPEIIRKQSR